MTNRTDRRLARIRSAFLGVTALAGITAISTPASAIVINDNFTPAQAVDTTNITGVGQMVIDLQNGFIGLCTVSLINPRTVIFASHCVNENPAGNGFQAETGYGAANGGLPIGFFFNANNNAAGNSAIGHWLNGVSGGPKDLTRVADNGYNSNFVVYDHQCCTMGLGNNFLQADIAMAALDTPAVGIPTWTLLFSPLSAPVHATITGYGDNGIGSTGQGTIDFKRRVAENVLSVLGSLDDQDTFLFGSPDGLPANLYMMDFNDPKFNTAQANVFDFNIFHDTAYTREGITAPGDSGGPLIVDHAFSSPTIAAVLSGGDRFYNAQKGASYGTTSFYQPLYLYWDWIIANNPYKYVVAKSGAGSWTDAAHWQMGLDPAYMTIDSNGNLVNALPTTAAQGIADVAPGFGLVCYFDDCIDITTGHHTNPTPAPGPNPTTTQVGGLMTRQQFDDLSATYANIHAVMSAGGPEVVSASTIESDPSTVPDTLVGTANNGGGGGDVNANPTTWTNPEGSVTIGGAAVTGAPGSTLGRAPSNQDANSTTGAPARYYDVTLSASGVTTLSGATITVDKLTVNGATAGLTIGATGVLNTLISSNSFAGTLQVDGVLNTAGGLNMFGGVLQGTGTVNGPTGFLIGAVAPGTSGTVGTLKINGAVGLGIGSTTAIDFTHTTTDLLQVTGAVSLSGTAIFSSLDAPQLGDAHVFLTATGGITGSYAAVPDTIVGVLYPVVTKQTVAGVDREVVTIAAQSFFTQFNSSSTDQTTIATALDALRAGNYNALLPLYQAIDPLTGAALAQALENLTPDTGRGAPLVGDAQTFGFDQLLQHQIGEIGGGSSNGQTAFRVDADGLKTAMGSASTTSSEALSLLSIGQTIATNPGGGNDPIPTGVPAAPNASDDVGMLLPPGTGGFITGSSLDGDVAIGGGGGRADVRGFVIAGGLDTPVGDGFTVGASFGYSDATAVLSTTPASIQSNSLQGALYARYDFWDHWSAQGFASYGHQTIQTRRIVVVGLSTFTLQGHTGGDAPSAGLYLGRRWGFNTLSGAEVSITPAVAVNYSESNVDAYTETGGAPAMTFAGYSEHSLLGKIGFDAKIGFHLFDIGVTPSVSAFLVEDLAGSNGSISAAFAAAPSAIMTFGLASRDTAYADLGVGAAFDLGDVFGTQATFAARYDTTTRNDVNVGAWTGRLSIKF